MSCLVLFLKFTCQVKSAFKLAIFLSHCIGYAMVQFLLDLWNLSSITYSQPFYSFWDLDAFLVYSICHKTTRSCAIVYWICQGTNNIIYLSVGTFCILHFPHRYDIHYSVRKYASYPILFDSFFVLMSWCLKPRQLMNIYQW